MISLLSQSPLYFALYLVALITAITIHEFSHAIVADRLGDPTPKLQGRVSLNPLKHLDPYGMLFLLFAGFGWGRPVEFDPFNLRDPRRDAALISIAGPISNILLAILLSIVVHIAPIVLLYPFIQLNVALAIFNLLPIHPLDGFKIVGGILPHDKAAEWYQLQRYGMIFLLFLIIPFGQQSMLSAIIEPPIRWVLGVLLPHASGSGII